MSRRVWQAIAIGLLGLLVGIAGTAAVLAYLPPSGTPPSIYDQFNWSSTANGFWHVNPEGATARIRGGTLTLAGHSIELDHQLQTDPRATVVSMRVRAFHFEKFGFGLGAFHAGTIGMELDNDGIKCGRGTDYGYEVDPLKTWTSPPTGQWMYLALSVKNPYKTPAAAVAAANLPEAQQKRVTLICDAYDDRGNLIATDTANNPEPNTRYAALSEAYVRTWDSNNQYQIDWMYAGPPAGDPLSKYVRNAKF